VIPERYTDIIFSPIYSVQFGDIYTEIQFLTERFLYSAGLITSMVKSLYEITECPQCASQNIIHNDKSMQIICKDCGLIYDPLKPFKNVGMMVAARESNNERIIRPVEKAPARKASKPKPITKKPAKPIRPAKKSKAKPVKKITKKPVSKPKKGIGAKVKGFMKKFIKRR
jgi:ribosomal protein S27E